MFIALMNRGVHTSCTVTCSSIGSSKSRPELDVAAGSDRLLLVGVGSTSRDKQRDMKERALAKGIYEGVIARMETPCS